MTITAKVVQFSANTSTGTQDVTSSGAGTCKGAIFHGTLGSANGTGIDDYALSIGWVDSDGDMRVCSLFGEDGGTNTDTYRYQGTTSCIFYITDTGTTDAEADWDSFITDGVRIDWTTAPGTAYLITATLFFDDGSDLNIETASLLPDADDGVAATASVGQSTDLLLTMALSTSTEGSVATFSNITFGAACNVATPQCVGMRVTDNDNAGTSIIRSVALDDRVDCNYAAGTLIDRGYEVTGLDAGGSSDSVEITTHLDDPGSPGPIDRPIYLLSFNFNGALSATCGWLTTPTSTGDNAVTGVGFEPQWLLLCQSKQTALAQESGALDATDPGLLSVAATDGTSSYVNAIWAEDAAATANCGCETNSSLIDFLEDDGSDLLTGTLSSFDSDGWTENYSAVDGSNALYYWYVAIEEDSATPFDDALMPRIADEVPVLEEEPEPAGGASMPVVFDGVAQPAECVVPDVVWAELEPLHPEPVVAPFIETIDPELMAPMAVVAPALVEMDVQRAPLTQVVKPPQVDAVTPFDAALFPAVQQALVLREEEFAESLQALSMPVQDFPVAPDIVHFWLTGELRATTQFDLFGSLVLTQWLSGRLRSAQQDLVGSLGVTRENQDWEVRKGDDLVLGYTIFDDKDKVEDGLGSATKIDWSCVDSAGVSLTLGGTLVGGNPVNGISWYTDGTDGKVLVTLSTSQTAALATGVVGASEISVTLGSVRYTAATGKGVAKAKIT